MTTDADEIGLGGARGGAKTEILLAFMAFRGNPKRADKLVSEGKPVKGANVMYIAHKNYRGLILREQANDLGDLIDRAQEMYGPTGAEIFRGNPPMARWRSGAQIIFGHFGDNGWSKYIGAQYQRVGIDQAEKMATKEIHDRIIGSCRSKWSELVPQVLLTFNPGGGDELSGAPGQAWLMDYFRIEAYLNGKVEPGQMVRDEHKKLRIFIPSKVTDNPYLLHYVERDAEGKITVYRPNEGTYAKWLNSIEPESLRRAWRDGDWGALMGGYFPGFRPNGHLDGEPLNASHVYKPEEVNLEPHFRRWAAIDWGYIHPSAILWNCKTPDERIYTYREVLLNRVEPFELGVLFARETRRDLERMPESPHMVLYLSPDAYWKSESENTKASKIVAGINRELGEGSAFLADLTEEERELKNAEEAMRSMHRRRAQQTKTRITVVRASDDRVHGWMMMQSMLRFRPLMKVVEPDKEFAEKLYREHGLAQYLEYMNLPEFKASQEVLPRWKISNQCQHLIRAMKEAMHKPGTNDVLKWDATESRPGDDALDCARYSIFSEEHQRESIAPLEARVTGRVEAMKVDMPGLSSQSLWMAERTARAAETKPKHQHQLTGRNRLAMQRAYQGTRSGSRTDWRNL